MTQITHNATLRVRDAVAELKASIRELIEDAAPEGVENIFDGVYPGRPTMSVRAARMTLFNAAVALLAADLKATGARKRAKGKV